jgi:hypothetical protein
MLNLHLSPTLTAHTKWEYPKQLKRPILLISLMNAVIILLVLVAYFQIQPFIPLFYTLPESEKQLVNKAWLFLFPVTSISITTLHLFLVKFFRYLSPLIIQLFVWTTVGVLFLLALVLIRIMLIVM